MRPSRALARSLAVTVALLMPVTARAQDADPEPEAAPPAARPVSRPRQVHRPEAHPAPRAAVQPKPSQAKAPESAPPPSPAELQPAIHARNAGAASCAPSVLEASAATIGAPHKAYSSWVTTDPNGHVFQSIVGIDQRNKTAPNSAVVISSVPTPARGCDTTTVQVFPTGRTCAALRQELLRDGSFTDELAGMPLIRSATGYQHLLMPGNGGGCVIVAVGTGLGAPPPAPLVQAAPPQARPQGVPVQAARPVPVPAATVPPSR